MKPLLSIITINYNNAKGLEKTIQSIISQTFDDYEYIVIDGGSNDGSVDIIKQYSDKITYWVSEPDKGIYNAMNKGIAKTQGGFLVFLNSGDTYLHNDALKAVVQIIRKENADVFYGQIIINEGGGDRTIVYPNMLTLTYQRNMVINHQACFFNSYTMKILGGYNESYKLAADYAYYLKAAMNHKKFVSIPFPVVRYDVSGISSRRMDEYRKEMLNIWDDIIPELITNDIDDYIQLSEKVHNSRIIKTAIKLQQFLKKIRDGAN